MFNPKWKISEEDRQQYRDYVRQTAVSILTECDAQEWKREHQDDWSKESSWSRFVDAMEYSGRITSEIDAYARVSSWQDAVYTLLCTSADPKHVDSGLYEGCGWEQTLRVLAYSCFEEEVQDAMRELYEEDDFPPVVMAYETNERQIGYRPDCRLFHIRKNEWVVELDNALKIYAPQHECVVVFEGEWAQSKKEYRILARRVYTMTDTGIHRALELCKIDYGVTEEPKEKT